MEKKICLVLCYGKEPFLRDHWYHLFVNISYHAFLKMQDGKLYKTYRMFSYRMGKMVILTKIGLTDEGSCDMINMLGQ